MCHKITSEQRLIVRRLQEQNPLRYAYGALSPDDGTFLHCAPFDRYESKKLARSGWVVVDGRKLVSDRKKGIYDV